MHETFFVKIGKRVENSVEHLSGLRDRERPLGKNLGENLVCVLSHEVEKRGGVDLATPGVKKARQVRMRQGCCRRTAGNLGFGGAINSRNELDGGLLRVISRQFREEDTALSRAAQPLEEGKSSVDDPSHPITANCRLVHDVTILL